MSLVAANLVLIFCKYVWIWYKRKVRLSYIRWGGFYLFFPWVSIVACDPELPRSVHHIIIIIWCVFLRANVWFCCKPPYWVHMEGRRRHQRPKKSSWDSDQSLVILVLYHSARPSQTPRDSGLSFMDPCATPLCTPRNIRNVCIWINMSFRSRVSIITRVTQEIRRPKSTWLNTLVSMFFFVFGSCKRRYTL